MFLSPTWYKTEAKLYFKELNVLSCWNWILIAKHFRLCQTSLLGAAQKIAVAFPSLLKDLFKTVLQIWLTSWSNL